MTTDDPKIHRLPFGRKPPPEGEELSAVYQAIEEYKAKGMEFMLVLGYDLEGSIEVVYGGGLENLAQFIGDIEILKQQILSQITVG